MTSRANYEVAQPFVAGRVVTVLRDLGPWNRYSTITNDVEAVVADLTQAGLLPPGRRLFYWDSDGDYAEILLKDGVFVGFRSDALEPRP